MAATSSMMMYFQLKLKTSTLASPLIPWAYTTTTHTTNNNPTSITSTTMIRALEMVVATRMAGKVNFSFTKKT